MSDPTDTQAPIEADPALVAAEETAETESAVDDQSLRDSTASISSSILEYRRIHGRTYQSSKTTEYWAPNDDQHVQGFDFAHQWLTMALGDKLYLPPIRDNPQRILDVGTGSGIWAIDMADKFPSATVIGVDISPMQPSWVPPNLTFQIDDVQLDWTFKPESFDFIHVRFMYGAIDDLSKLYRQIYDHLKPGGWFQHLEPDILLRSDNPEVVVDKDHIFTKWAQLFYDAGDKLGRTFKFNDGRLEKLATDAGFTEIVYKKIKIPYGTWPKDKKLKELGMYTGHYLEQSLDGFAIYPIGQILGWTLEEVQALVAKKRATLKNPKNLPNGDMLVVYGRKPEKPPASAKA